jgi:TonB family protein
MPDHPAPETEFPNLQGSGSSAESDLGELAALFAAHGGGDLSAEVSADLALEIVLNEIVEQACLATGATGAAIVLLRDGEMVCRASSGANAPELGAPLGSESGLTAECVKIRQVQRCDDAQTDPRVDAEASRSLGVRSVMVFPLLRNGEMTGVLEIFSSRPGAFGDRDELTLEALAHRIVKNLDRASETASVPPSTVTSHAAANTATHNLSTEAVEPPAVAFAEESSADSNRSLEKLEKKEHNDVFPETEQSPRTGFDVVTMALVAAVVACAILLGTLVGVRLGWRRVTGVREQVIKSAGAGFSSRSTANSSAAQDAAAPNNSTRAREPATTAPSSSDVDEAENAKSADSGKRNTATPNTPPAGAKDSPPPSGSLLVYENGKEVFRMPPAAEGEVAKTSHGSPSVPRGVPGSVQRASALEPAGIVELPPDAANGSLLHRVEPEYPEEARQQRIQGAVVLEVRIGRDGAIQDVKLVSGQPLLADAAIAAVKQWRFKPRVLKGQPVEMQTTVTLNFRMPA